MAWDETCVMDERMAFIVDYRSGDYCFAELCRPCHPRPRRVDLVVPCRRSLCQQGRTRRGAVVVAGAGILRVRLEKVEALAFGIGQVFADGFFRDTATFAASAACTVPGPAIGRNPKAEPTQAAIIRDRSIVGLPFDCSTTGACLAKSASFGLVSSLRDKSASGTISLKLDRQ